MHTYEQALSDSIEYFNGDELAGKVFVDKYALRNKDELLHENTPTDMHWRIAKNIARIQKKKYLSPLPEKRIFELIDQFKYIVPQGSPMYGIGNPNYVSIGNCFVLDPPEDTYNSILATDEQLVQISKRRGGVGIDLSKLRPVGSNTNNSSNTSTGVPAFMERYSNSIREVGQAGRRGALMESLSVHHPDVEAFATIKKDKTKVTGANISVRLTDDFLKAVQNNEEYVQRWPLTGKAKIRKKVLATDVWHTLITSAHEMAEPGLLFWDNIIKESPADCYENFKSVSTNPCAELPLSAMDACRLLCLNLLSYVVDPYTENAKFDFKLFFNHSQIAARMMDDIVDLEEECINRILEKIESDPDPEEIKCRERSIWERILESCVSGRRCGLGITALGDTLASLGLSYGSDESIAMSEKIYQALKLGSYTASVDMAEELGTFDGWDYEKEKNCPFLKRFKQDVLEYEGEVLIKGKDLYERMKVVGRRNIAMLTIAPTGSVSTMTRTTSGVEPAYLLEYTRRKKGNPGDSKFRVDFVDGSGDSWMEFKVYHPQVAEWMKITGETDVEKSPWFGCCAPDLDWTKRVKLQSALQRHCDHSISSTVNLPSDATVDQVKEIYETAWKSGCKGITVYRDGSRTGVLVKDTKKEDAVIIRFSLNANVMTFLVKFITLALRLNRILY